MNLIATAVTGAETADLSTPLGALSEFYSAFNTRDLEKMRGNWHQLECVLNNPLGGIRRGWAEIEPLYSRLFNGPAKVHVEFYDYTLHIGKDIFCAAGRERGRFEKGDVQIDLTIRTSRIYRRVGNLWLQIHHHGSIDDPELLAKYQQAVMRD
jgi:hypothetical protein